MKTLLIAIALVLGGTSAFASDDTSVCKLNAQRTGLHTISSTAGELGDSEDGSPVILRGYVLVLDCGLPLNENFFFSSKEEAHNLNNLLKGLPNGAAITINVRTNAAGMEGRDSVILTSAASINGSAAGLNGIPLSFTTKIR